MAHVGSLRESRSARGINIECTLGELRWCALIGGERCAGQPRTLAVQLGEPIRGRSKGPDADLAAEPITDGCDSFAVLAARDHVPRLDDLERVAQQLSRQVGVDECDSDADVTQAEPDR